MNIELFNFLNNFAASSPSISSAAVFLANDLGYLLLVLLAYFLITHEDKKRAARELLTIILAALAAGLIADLVKYFFYVPRPFVALPDVNLLFPHEDSGALPSFHATFFSALAVAMWFYHKKLAYFLAFGAVLIGIARVMAGVHFPIDILAGFVLGPAVAAIAYFLAGKISRLRVTKIPDSREN